MTISGPHGPGEWAVYHDDGAALVGFRYANGAWAERTVDNSPVYASADEAQLIADHRNEANVDPTIF